jgi:hypothetical protein
MSDHGLPARALINIAARPGAAELLLALHRREGSATVSQLRCADTGDIINIVPMLAAAGLITSRGTLDGVDSATQLTLTADGENAAGALVRLEDWAHRRQWRSPGRPGWSKPLRALTLFFHTLQRRIDGPK